MNIVSQKPKSSQHFDAKEVLSFLKTVAVFLVVALFLRGTVVEAFKIPSGSMIPTLRIGDHILVNKLSYGIRLPFVPKTLFRYREPERGDVVVFTLPDDPLTQDNESSINIIKRVIGLPGDSVEIKDARVYVNGQELSEEYARWDTGGLGDDIYGPTTIPAGHIFLMGDNRDHSRDSRVWKKPFLELDRVKGRAFVIYWSWDSPSRLAQIVR